MLTFKLPERAHLLTTSRWLAVVWPDGHRALSEGELRLLRKPPANAAVSAAAYMSCSRMLNDYDGVQHDYTRKRGLLWQQVFLPSNAPAEWSDREKL